MRGVFKIGVCVSASALALVMALGTHVETQSGFSETLLRAGAATTAAAAIADAPAAFDGESNGFAEEYCRNQDDLTDSPNSPGIEDEECSFDDAAAEFGGSETEDDGVGPVFNATGCGQCHIAPILGGGSQIAERRAGYFNGFQFIEHPGGSLIHDRANKLADLETVIESRTNVFTFRGSQSVLGDGFVEAVGNNTLQSIAAAQPSALRGQIINVDVFEKPGEKRIGRFGWKGQQASLLSFSADAYLNEMGITSPLTPTENTSNGNPVDDDGVVDDEGGDVELFALFMRSTKVPPRDTVLAASPDAIAGSTLFNQIGCATCHTREMVTAPPGTSINGGAMKVANALGNKRIHPFGDFLLHDVGTGDGIVQNGGASTRNKVRTAPLWELRARTRFMHDFQSHSIEDAIQRHGNQAEGARRAYYGLSRTSRSRLLTFLRSL
jgi:CxxC motif-containing protein (DUF1111 family)